VIDQILLAGILFLVPSNLFLKFITERAYFHGLLIDYLIPKIYASDILIILFCAMTLSRINIWQTIRQNFRFQIITSAGISLLILFVARQLLSQNPIASTWFFFKIVEMILFAGCLFSKKELLQKPVALAVMTAGILFQSLVGISQFLTQSSVFHSYLALGEPNLSHPLGLATGIFFGQQKILPYGTTAHPNILGGYLAVGMLFLLTQWQQNSKFRPVLAICILAAAIALFLTQSVSAELTLLIGFLFLTAAKLPKLWQKISSTQFLGGVVVASLVLVPFLISFAAAKYPAATTLTRRAILNAAGWQTFTHNPGWGVGLNTFPMSVEKYSTQKEIIRFVQPVHHVGILWLAETGMLGIGLIIFALALLKKKLLLQPLLLTTVLLLPILTLDHYLYTQQTGLLMFIFIWNATRQHQKN
jgi:hypothetical protein